MVIPPGGNISTCGEKNLFLHCRKALEKQQGFSPVSTNKGKGFE